MKRHENGNGREDDKPLEGGFRVRPKLSWGENTKESTNEYDEKYEKNLNSYVLYRIWNSLFQLLKIK